jgi:hypothetical protein
MISHFIVLEIPWNNNKNIIFTDSDILVDLSLDPPDPCCAIETADTDFICTHSIHRT